ncbi:MAG: RsmB/NOP family class I SAM-dependent RNA methyltransferase [Candidatus Gottesmanbacteria bacterium]
MKDAWRQLPEEFLNRLDKIVPQEQLQRVLHAYTILRPTTIRVNTLKTTTEKLLAILKEHNIVYEPSDISPISFIITNEKRDLLDLEAYTQGFFYIQSLSSQLPALSLDPQPGEKILDIAAAPGSKTTQIAALMDNTGEIVANDNSRIRVYKLQANLKTQGVTNTEIVISAGQTLWQTYPEYFDRALVDVPCSMEGTFTTTNPKTYEHWNRKEIKELVQRQKWLLRSAVSATKPGGIIVYSTCTLEPAENEHVIEWILKKEKGCLELVKPVTRIYPSDTMEGFFVATLRKTASTIPTSLRVAKNQAIQ